MHRFEEFAAPESAAWDCWHDLRNVLQRGLNLSTQLYRALNSPGQKGALNRKDRLHQQALAAATIAAALTPEQVAELTPLEVMRAIMRNRFRAGDYNGALAAARECAPYCHARLAQTEMRITGELSTMSDADLAQEIAALEARIATSGTVH